MGEEFGQSEEERDDPGLEVAQGEDVPYFTNAGLYKVAFALLLGLADYFMLELALLFQGLAYDLNGL